MTQIYFQIILALVAVVGLAFAIGFFLKKKQDNSGLIEVLAYQPLGFKKGISLIRVGKEVLVVGVTSTDFKLLKTLKEGDLESDEGVLNISDRINALRSIKEEFANGAK